MREDEKNENYITYKSQFSYIKTKNFKANSLFHTVEYKNHSVGYIFHTVKYKSRTVKQRIFQSVWKNVSGFFIEKQYIDRISLLSVFFNDLT